MLFLLLGSRLLIMMGRRYECHPDSGVKFEGWQIPRYDELVSTVKEMHLNVMPDHPYIGWDMALTDEGWVVIECNWGQLLNQYVDHIGLKNEFMEYVIKIITSRKWSSTYGRITELNTFNCTY